MRIMKLGAVVAAATAALTLGVGATAATAAPHTTPGANPIIIWGE